MQILQRGIIWSFVHPPPPPLSHTVSKCTSYDWSNDRLDIFIFDLLDSRKFIFSNNIFTNIVKRILLLFHTNADVERRFSINKDYFVENMTEASLTAQRRTVVHFIKLLISKPLSVNKNSD